MAQGRLLQSDALHQVNDGLVEGNSRQRGAAAGNAGGAVGGISHNIWVDFEINGPKILSPACSF